LTIIGESALISIVGSMVAGAGWPVGNTRNAPSMTKATAASTPITPHGRRGRAVASGVCARLPAAAAKRTLGMASVVPNS
jgi:hypothetical protein